MGWEERDYYRERPGFGSRLGKGSVVTWLLIINCVVFVLDAILSGGMRVPAWLSPHWAGNFNVAQGVFGFELWRWLTYQFLHAGFFHILFNMIGLYFFGPLLEQWWGSKRFLAFYLLCGVSGALLMSLFVLIAPGVIVPAGVDAQSIKLVGASGSIFGILAGAATLFPKQRVMLLFPPIPMSMRTMALIFLGIAALSLLAGTRNAGGEAAHLGGALLGFLLVRQPRWLDWADRFSPGAIQRNVNQGRFERQRKREAAREAELDRVLAKVKDKGLQSLSRREKRVLQQATNARRGE